MNQRSVVTSTWSPLRQSVFRALWIATIASNVGTWMQDVGAAWLMTSLSNSPLMVALVESATTLPMFMLALPAGALADILDRRRLLLITQGWMMFAAAALGMLTYLGITTPWLLLTLTFLLGFGAAMNAPAWQAIVPELVQYRDLHSAVALNSIGFNISRALGPALGGLIISAAGVYPTFLLNAVTFLGVMVVLYRWERTPSESALPSERLFGAMKAGVRYVRQSPPLRNTLYRSVAFILFASVLWSLMPVYARNTLGLGASGYGMILTFIGLGAVAGAEALSRVRKTLSIDHVVTVSASVFGIAITTLAFIQDFVMVCVLMFVCGGAWLTLLSRLNASVQSSVPSWVRARALSVYLLLFFGTFALGSFLWGLTASHIGIPETFLTAGIGLFAGLVITARFRLKDYEGMDLSPTKRWPTPTSFDDVDPRSGPVLVTVEYRIDPGRSEGFAKVMNEVKRTRLRDGAIRWNLYRDTEDKGKYLETFVVESWLEHLRQHERITASDNDLLDQALKFHLGDKPPVVSHLIAERLK